MIREDPIIVDEKGSALFYAITSFGDNTPLRFPRKERMIEVLERPKTGFYIVHMDNFGRMSYSSYVPNYSSDEEWEKDMIAYQSARIAYIYNYLKEHFPNDPFANNYRDELTTDYWVEKLNLDVDSILSQ